MPVTSNRGFAEVNNRFGMNCFACHAQAKAEFDLICERDHGCDPIPVTRAMSDALQTTDPRCKNQQPVSAEDATAQGFRRSLQGTESEQGNRQTSTSSQGGGVHVNTSPVYWTHLIRVFACRERPLPACTKYSILEFDFRAFVGAAVQPIST